ncbi:hypothetical protein ACE6H2_015022 [Prunus campanulata]
METLPVCLAAEKMWEKKLFGDLTLDSDFWNAGSWVHPKDRGKQRPFVRLSGGRRGFRVGGDGGEGGGERGGVHEGREIEGEEEEGVGFGDGGVYRLTENLVVVEAKRIGGDAGPYREMWKNKLRPHLMCPDDHEISPPLPTPPSSATSSSSSLAQLID